MLVRKTRNISINR